MAVYRKREKWCAQVFSNGRRVATKSGFVRRRDAEKWHDETAAAYRSGAVVDKNRSTIDEALSRFEMYHLPTVRAGTRARYVVDIEYRIKPFFKFYRLEQVTAELLEAFKAKISETLSPKSVNNCLHVLRLILNKAVRYGLIKESPYKLESLSISRKPYPWWEDRQDIARFLEEAKSSRYYAVYLLALETGMRYGEIMGLTVKDVDLEQGTIHVHRQWLEREGQYGPTKHGKERWIDISPAGEISRCLRDTIWILGRAAGPGSEGGEILSGNNERRLFTTATGAPPTKGGVAHKYFKAAIRRAQVPEICFHGLRHTFASWYMREHDDIWTLMAILGHGNVKTTMRYAHHSKRERQKPLDMASVITHKSHTRENLRIVTGGNYEEKRWRDGRDLNSQTPKAASE